MTKEYTDPFKDKREFDDKILLNRTLSLWALVLSITGIMLDIDAAPKNLYLYLIISIIFIVIIVTNKYVRREIRSFFKNRKNDIVAIYYFHQFKYFVNRFNEFINKRYIVDEICKQTKSEDTLKYKRSEYSKLKTKIRKFKGYHKDLNDMIDEFNKIITGYKHYCIKEPMDKIKKSDVDSGFKDSCKYLKIDYEHFIVSYVTFVDIIKYKFEEPFSMYIRDFVIDEESG